MNKELISKGYLELKKSFPKRTTWEGAHLLTELIMVYRDNMNDCDKRSLILLLMLGLETIEGAFSEAADCGLIGSVDKQMQIYRKILKKKPKKLRIQR